VTKSYVKKSAQLYAHWVVRVHITYSPSLPICPEPTPIGDIPCEAPSQTVPVYGSVVPGKRELQQQLPAGVGTTGAICSPSGHSCTAVFDVFPNEFHGTLVQVWGVVVGDLTHNPKGDGPWPAGFEFPVAFYIPAPTG